MESTRIDLLLLPLPLSSLDECQGLLERVQKSLADLETQSQKMERGIKRRQLSSLNYSPHFNISIIL